MQARAGERGQDYVTVTFEEIEASAPAGTDLAAVRAGWASVTELGAPCEGDGLAPGPRARPGG